MRYGTGTGVGCPSGTATQEGVKHRKPATAQIVPTTKGEEDDDRW